MPRPQRSRETLQHQLRTPLAMGQMLPPGLLGLACAALLGLFISTHDTYLHSWGSILVQDVVLPLRRKPISPSTHLWLLRLSVCGVAVFIFFVSLFFQHTQYIAMFCALTASMFVGGAGAVIVGGLYWKRGTTTAAWSAMIIGMIASLAGISIKKIEPDFFLTGQEMSFLAIVLAVATYVGVSLFGPRATHDMDRLLHRGKYAVADEGGTAPRKPATIREKLGVTSDFTGPDRFVAYLTVGWPLLWTIIFIAVTAYTLLVGIPAETWLTFWHGWTWFILACGVVVMVWFAIGGFCDLRKMFRQLRTRQVDVRDDGRVEG